MMGLYKHPWDELKRRSLHALTGRRVYNYGKQHGKATSKYRASDRKRLLWLRKFEPGSTSNIRRKDV
jgi:hypothetical protein